MDKAQKDISVTLDKLMKQQQQMQATLLDLEDSRARKGWKQYRREADREDRLLELLGGVLLIIVCPCQCPGHHHTIPCHHWTDPSHLSSCKCQPHHHICYSRQLYGTMAICSLIHLKIMCSLQVITGPRTTNYN